MPTAALIEHVVDRPGHDRRYAIDETKARTELGYSPARGFAECFNDTVNWYLENETWWRAAMNER